MEHRQGQTTKPISIRLTPEERGRLEAWAGRRSLSDYVRARLFNDEVRGRRIHIPKNDARDVAQVLAKLGQSELAASLRELREAARNGALPVTPETEHSIRAACEAVDQLRLKLIRALGLLQRGDE
jgi:hypothetical protein